MKRAATHDGTRIWTALRLLAMGAAGAAVLGTGCVADEPKLSSNRGMTYDEFKALASKELWEGGGYIIDGDVPVATEDELYKIWGSLQPGALAVKTDSTGDVAWDAQTKIALRYCVSDNFGARKPEVIEAMANASDHGWETIANVNFIYAPEQDATCTSTNTNVVFDVSPLVDVQNPPLARSFFPDDIRTRRNVIIHASAFVHEWGLTAILTHELGHTLGFRHEHIRPEAMSNCTETDDYRVLTEYDSASVMHYPQCNGTAPVPTLTAKDAAGAAALYGPPQQGDADPVDPQGADGGSDGETTALTGTQVDNTVSGGCSSGGGAVQLWTLAAPLMVALGRRRRNGKRCGGRRPDGQTRFDIGVRTESRRG